MAGGRGSPCKVWAAPLHFRAHWRPPITHESRMLSLAQARPKGAKKLAHFEPSQYHQACLGKAPLRSVTFHFIFHRVGVIFLRGIQHRTQLNQVIHCPYQLLQLLETPSHGSKAKEVLLCMWQARRSRRSTNGQSHERDQGVVFGTRCGWQPTSEVDVRR